MTKIDIFSGFLGAGKTTLIKKLIAEAYSGEKLVLIENEFGEINIDGGFLKESGIEISEMSAGCICCSLVGDFNKALKEVVAQFHPDRILIEPSGVGKLSDVIVAVQRTVDECPELKLNSYVTVADASKVKVYMKNFGEFYNNQIEAAGTIILSRTQKMTQEKLETAVSMLREKNADAAIITTPWDELDGKAILSAIEKVSLADELLEKMRAEHEADEHEHHHHDHDDEDHDHEAEPADHAEGEADNTDGQNAAEDDHYDEHVWLSLKNAIVCTETLADAITELDSDNAKQYVTNAKTYTGKLEALDDDYQTMRDAATQTTILVGDRFPFLYLAEDYDIHYFAAYSGCSADVEASVHTVTYLAEKLQEYKLQAIYVVDNGTDSLANTIAESAEMQPKILHLSSMQSVTKDDIEKGCTYLSYMEENLQMLKQGLQAP